MVNGMASEASAPCVDRSSLSMILTTVKPVCNDHLCNKIYYLWFIEQWVLMKTEGTNLTISAFWSLLAKGHLDELQKAEKYPIRWPL